MALTKRRKRLFLVLALSLILCGCLCSRPGFRVRYHLFFLSFEDYSNRQYRAEKIVAMGPPAIPALTAQLDYYRRGMTMNIIDMLERIGPEGVDALDDWREHCEYPEMRILLARELVRIRGDKEYIQCVAEGLLSESRGARLAARDYIDQYLEEAVFSRGPAFTAERARHLKAQFDEWWSEHSDDLHWDDTARTFVLTPASNEQRGVDPRVFAHEHHL